MESLTQYVLRSFVHGPPLADAMEHSPFANLSQLCAASGVDPQAIATFVGGGALGSADAIRLRGVLPGLSWAALAGDAPPATRKHVPAEQRAGQRRNHARPPYPDPGPA
ncbi:hypothetical protein [Deinococcus marmoris]|uniref:hypothetical protein n=1 Tax=Deinococcus marmoris TaxID=249408 RepID=UPI0011153CC0|nr:hypothetical protein [Deinococcus marmoris]